MPIFEKTDFSDEKTRFFFLQYSSSASQRGVGDQYRPLDHGERPIASWGEYRKIPAWPDPLDTKSLISQGKMSKMMENHAKTKFCATLFV